MNWSLSCLIGRSVVRTVWNEIDEGEPGGSSLPNKVTFKTFLSYRKKEMLSLSPLSCKEASARNGREMRMRMRMNKKREKNPKRREERKRKRD